MIANYLLGEEEISNKDLAIKFPEWKMQRFERRVGIMRRFVTTETSLSLSTKLPIPGVGLTTDVLIYVTQTNEFAIPGDAFVFSSRLNLKCREIVQISSGCSGFADAMNLAITISKPGENIMIVCSDTYSKGINSNECRDVLLFSDCASFYFFNRDECELVDYKTKIQCEDYSAIEMLSLERRFNMDGRRVYAFVINKVIPFLLENLTSQTEVLYLHQANKMMLEEIKTALYSKFPNLHIPIFIKDGNTVSSSLIKLFIDSDIDVTGKTVSFCGFGVGLKMSLITMKF